MRHGLLSLALLVLVSCQPAEEPEATSTGATETGTTAPPPQPIVISGEFQTPESAVYDPEQDVYFVSNINGSPTEADDNGFISRINAETRQVELKWIDGANDAVKLDAPKGLAISGDELLVTDITRIRRFDRRTGKPKGEIAVRGSSFMNDLSPDGQFASDSGLKFEAGNFSPSGTDAVYRIRSGAARKIASGDDLGRPNGIVSTGTDPWIVSFGSGELYQIVNGKRAGVMKLPKGSLDGLIAMPDGTLLISSWEGKSIYRGSPGGTFQEVITNVDSPADIGFDSKRNLVVVPHFVENRITLHPL